MSLGKKLLKIGVASIIASATATAAVDYRDFPTARHLEQVGPLSVTELLGQDRGGGNVVWCTGPQGDSIEVLDLFESRELGLLPDTGLSSVSYLDKLKFVFDRWAKFDPVLAEHFRSRAAEFEKSVAFIDRSYLKVIRDSGEFIAARGACHLQQIAMSRLETLGPGEMKYVVDKSLWSRLSDEDRAGLVLHEILWAQYKGANSSVPSSVFVRRLVGFLASPLLNTYSPYQYLDFIRAIWPEIDPDRYYFQAIQANREGTSVNTPSIRLNRRVYSINNLLDIQEGVVRTASLPYSQLLRVGTYEYWVGGAHSAQDNSANFCEVVMFHDDGALKEGCLASEIEIPLPGLAKVKIRRGARIELSREGQLLAANSDPRATSQTCLGDRSGISVLKWHGAQFPLLSINMFDDGRVESISFHGSPCGGARFSFTWKGERFIEQGIWDWTHQYPIRPGRIAFDRDGQIIFQAGVVRSN